MTTSASKPQATTRAASAKPVGNPAHPFAETLKRFATASGKQGLFHSLPALARRWPRVARLPVSLRIVLESVLRNCDGRRIAPALCGATGLLVVRPASAIGRVQNPGKAPG